MRGIVLIVTLALIACDPPGRAGRPDTVSPAGGESSDVPIAVPENAIQVGEQYYMVPLEEEVQGCRAFRPFSPTGRVQQAIYYRTADGRFTPDRGQANCE